jgi:hypothetical protein
MLLANMSVAAIISDAFPDQALLRRHPAPNQRKMQELCDTAAGLVRSCVLLLFLFLSFSVCCYFLCNLLLFLLPDSNCAFSPSIVLAGYCISAVST